MSSMQHKVPVPQGEVQEVRYNLEDLKPNLSSSGVLTMQLPVFYRTGPLMHEEAMREVETQMGLSTREVEQGIEDMMEGFESLMLGKMFQKRRK